MDPHMNRNWHDNKNKDCPWNDPETFCNPVTAGMGCTCPPPHVMHQVFIEIIHKAFDILEVDEMEFRGRKYRRTADRQLWVLDWVEVKQL